MVVEIQEKESSSAAQKRVLASLTKAGIIWHGKRTSKAGKHVYLIEYEQRKYTLATYEQLDSFARLCTIRQEYPEFKHITWKHWQVEGIRGTILEIVRSYEKAKRLQTLLALQLREEKKV